MKPAFIVIGIFVSIVNAVSINTTTHLSNKHLAVNRIFLYVNLSLTICSFLYLIKKMYQKHYYEFKKNSFSMVSIFVMMSLVLAQTFQFQETNELYISKENNCREHYPDDPEIVKTFIEFIIFESHFLALFNSYIILYLKSSRDILQGISKLDCWTKVSSFQILKNVSDRNVFSVLTTDNLQTSPDSTTYSKIVREQTNYWPNFQN